MNAYVGLLHALTIFMSAFLLFQVQPLIARFILPWFGGSPAVWTASMLFFQVALLGGYLYAHLLSSWLPARAQALVHGALLAVAVITLPIAPDAALQPGADGDPTLRVFLILALSVGLPYFVLATTGPLVQRWFSQLPGGRSPYRLYALSNAGSLLGLVTYPIIFEPFLTRGTQVLTWSVGFAVVAIAYGASALLATRTAPVRPAREIDQDAPRPRRRDVALWLALPACASVLLLAVTNQLCQDVAAVPFLWVLPLALYLCSFIICFDAARWYRRGPFLLMLLLGIEGAWVMLTRGPGTPILVQVAVFCGALFAACMVCHGELYRLRPSPRHLTAFYLMVATGGALGGIFVGVLAPMLFDSYVELHIGLVACGVLAFIVINRAPDDGVRRLPRWARLGFGVVVVMLALGLGVHAISLRDDAIVVKRNFHGVLRVLEHDAGIPSRHRFVMMHGAIEHGLQHVAPERSFRPVAYYGDESGIGLALRHTERQYGRHVGVIGLGVGNVVSHLTAEDRIRFYELNPDVETLARTHFSYLEVTPAEVSVVVGDGRLTLEREESQGFDVLMLDAFSGDAVPVHLLTREAFATYDRHLAEDGVIAVQITNRHLDLVPVVRQLAASMVPPFEARIVVSAAAEGQSLHRATYALLTRNDHILELLEPAATRLESLDPDTPLWTDDYSNLFHVLRVFGRDRE